MGAEAIGDLLKEIDLDQAILKLNKEIAKSKTEFGQRKMLKYSTSKALLLSIIIVCFLVPVLLTAQEYDEDDYDGFSREAFASLYVSYREDGSAHISLMFYNLPD